MRGRDNILNLVRRLSALLMMLGTLPGFFDFRDLENSGLAKKVFYFATGLGHQAVIVFHVIELSTKLYHFPLTPLWETSCGSDRLFYLL